MLNQVNIYHCVAELNNLEQRRNGLLLENKNQARRSVKLYFPAIPRS